MTSDFFPPAYCSLLEWLNPEPFNSDPDAVDEVVCFLDFIYLKQNSLQRLPLKIVITY